jgi:hypothetical protein
MTDEKETKLGQPAGSLGAAHFSEDGRRCQAMVEVEEASRPVKYLYKARGTHSKQSMDFLL